MKETPDTTGIEEYKYPSIEHNGEDWIRIVDHIALTERELQKARHDWLREEIVKLEGMKREAYTFSDDEMNEWIGGDECLGYNKALQTIINRYQSELDQDISNKSNEN